MVKLVDNKGRVFGKINIIDLLVVLFILVFLGTFIIPNSPAQVVWKSLHNPTITMTVKLYEAEHEAIRLQCNQQCDTQKHLLKADHAIELMAAKERIRAQLYQEYLPAVQTQKQLEALLRRFPRLRRYIQ
jgi:competence protein ComGC